MYYFILCVIAVVGILCSYRFWKSLDSAESDLNKSKEDNEYERVSHNETKNRMKVIEAEYEKAVRDKNTAITIQRALEDQIRERDTLLAEHLRVPETTAVSESVIITTPDVDPVENSGIGEWDYSRAPRNVRRTITIAAFESEIGQKPTWLVEFSSEFFNAHPKILKMFSTPEKSLISKVKKDGTVVVAGVD